MWEVDGMNAVLGNDRHASLLILMMIDTLNDIPPSLPVPRPTRSPCLHTACSPFLDQWVGL